MSIRGFIFHLTKEIAFRFRQTKQGRKPRRFSLKITDKHSIQLGYFEQKPVGFASNSIKDNRPVYPTGAEIKMNFQPHIQKAEGFLSIPVKK